MDEVRVAVIGVGNIGGAHAENIFNGRVPGMRLAALCDTAERAREAAKKRLPGVTVYENMAALLAAGGVDAVIIATPHPFHQPMARDALRAGLHVLTEKPAGTRASDAQLTNRIAADSGLVYNIMFNQRTEPIFRRARELLQQGAIGRPQRLSWIITNWFRTQAYYNSSDWRATWQGEGGGVLSNQAPHQLDLLQWIFGMPSAVSAFCRIGGMHDIEVEDEAQLLMSYKNGATAQFITSTGELPGTNRLEICGTGGKMLLENGELTLTRAAQSAEVIIRDNPEIWPNIPCESVREPVAESVDGHLAVLCNFADSILHGAEPIARGEEGINSLTITNAAYLSAHTGRRVELPFDFEEYDRLLEQRCKNSAQPRRDVGAAAVSSPHSCGDSSRWQVNW